MSKDPEREGMLELSGLLHSHSQSGAPVLLLKGCWCLAVWLNWRWPLNAVGNGSHLLCPASLAGAGRRVPPSGRDNISQFLCPARISGWSCYFLHGFKLKDVTFGVDSQSSYTSPSALLTVPRAVQVTIQISLFINANQFLSSMVIPWASSNQQLNWSQPN